MDGVTPASAPASAAARLRAEAAGLHESAERDQIEPGGTLGHWLRAQETALLGLAEMIEHMDRTALRLEERVAATIENTRELSVSEVQKLKQATALANSTIEALRVTEAVVKLQADEAVSTVVKSVTPELVKVLTTVTVLKERSWNLRQNLTGVAVFAGVLLGVFGVGYISGGGNFQSRQPGELATAALARCRDAAKPDSSGAPWCPVSVLREPTLEVTK